MKRVSRIIQGLLPWGLTLFLIFGYVGHAGAKELKGLKEGDILVADVDKGAIILVDPVTGAKTIISLGGYLVGPTGLAIDEKGDILVADPSAGAVIRVDPKTGAQTLVSLGGSFVLPYDLAIDATGQILVVDADAFGGSGGIIRVDPVTGVQTVISSGGSFVGPLRVVVDSAGQIFVSDQSAFRTGNTIGAIFQVDPVTGQQTVIYNSSTGGSIQGNHGLALDAAGQILVAFRGHPDFSGPDGVASIEPVINGVVTVVSSDGSFVGPFGIAVVSKVPKKP